MTREQRQALARFRRGIKLAEDAVPHLGAVLHEVPEIARLLVLLGELKALNLRRHELGKALVEELKAQGINVQGGWPQEVGAEIMRLCGV